MPLDEALGEVPRLVMGACEAALVRSRPAAVARGQRSAKGMSRSGACWCGGSDPSPSGTCGSVRLERSRSAGSLGCASGDGPRWGSSHWSSVWCSPCRWACTSRAATVTRAAASKQACLFIVSVQSARQVGRPVCRRRRQAGRGLAGGPRLTQPTGHFARATRSGDRRRAPIPAAREEERAAARGAAVPGFAQIRECPRCALLGGEREAPAEPPPETWPRLGGGLDLPRSRPPQQELGRRHRRACAGRRNGASTQAKGSTQPLSGGGNVYRSCVTAISICRRPLLSGATSIPEPGPGSWGSFLARPRRPRRARRCRRSPW